MAIQTPCFSNLAALADFVGRHEHLPEGRLRGSERGKGKDENDGDESVRTHGSPRD